MGEVETVCTQFWSENLKGIEHLGDLDVDGRIILKWLLNVGMIWIGFVWLRVGINGVLL
jgi:hypothetical protein